MSDKSSNGSNHSRHETQQMVVPVRTGVRKGQIDWISPISQASEFKSWVFRFKMGATCYLSKAVYPEDEERRCAWQISLLRAATLGNFHEMLDMLELLDADGVTCEDVLEHLKKRFLPALETERKRAMQKFVNFTRGSRSLLDAVKELKVLLLDCRKQEYKPDEDTVMLKYESLLSSSDLPIFRLYQMKVGDTGTEMGRFMRALEELAQDQVPQKPEGTQGGQPFAGAAVNGRKNGAANDKQGNGDRRKCTYCGHGNCPTLSGEGKEECPAFGQECRKCGKKGHFKSVCRSKEELPEQAAAAVRARKSVSLEGF